jgi:hypothetical protein
VTETTLRRRKESMYSVRAFDPRHLGNLELWLPHFNLPTGTPGSTILSGQNWPGAPDLGPFPGSQADGIWSANPFGKAYRVGPTPAVGPVWDFPWIKPARGLGVLGVHLELVDRGTSTPRTITLPGPLTFLGVIRNSEGLTGFLLDDGEEVPTTGFGVTSDRLQVWPAGVGSEVDVCDDSPEFDGTIQGDIVLFLATRNASDNWRCWINGVERSIGLNQAGAIELKSAFETDDTFNLEVADLLVYSEDWSSRATDLNRYFRGQYGTP